MSLALLRAASASPFSAVAADFSSPSSISGHSYPSSEQQEGHYPGVFLPPFSLSNTVLPPTASSATSPPYDALSEEVKTAARASAIINNIPPHLMALWRGVMDAARDELAQDVAAVAGATQAAATELSPAALIAESTAADVTVLMARFEAARKGREAAKAAVSAVSSSISGGASTPRGVAAAGDDQGSDVATPLLALCRPALASTLTAFQRAWAKWLLDVRRDGGSRTGSSAAAAHHQPQLLSVSTVSAAMPHAAACNSTPSVSGSTTGAAPWFCRTAADGEAAAAFAAAAAESRAIAGRVAVAQRALAEATAGATSVQTACEAARAELEAVVEADVVASEGGEESAESHAGTTSSASPYSSASRAHDRAELTALAVRHARRVLREERSAAVAAAAADASATLSRMRREGRVAMQALVAAASASWGTQAEEVEAGHAEDIRVVTARVAAARARLDGQAALVPLRARVGEAVAAAVASVASGDNRESACRSLSVGLAAVLAAAPFSEELHATLRAVRPELEGLRARGGAPSLLSVGEEDTPVLSALLRHSRSGKLAGVPPPPSQAQAQQQQQQQNQQRQQLMRHIKEGMRRRREQGREGEPLAEGAGQDGGSDGEDGRESGQHGSGTRRSTRRSSASTASSAVAKPKWVSIADDAPSLFDRRRSGGSGRRAATHVAPHSSTNGREDTYTSSSFPAPRAKSVGAFAAAIPPSSNSSPSSLYTAPPTVAVAPLPRATTSVNRASVAPPPAEAPSRGGPAIPRTERGARAAVVPVAAAAASWAPRRSSKPTDSASLHTATVHRASSSTPSGATAPLSTQGGGGGSGDERDDDGHVDESEEGATSAAPQSQSLRGVQRPARELSTRRAAWGSIFNDIGRGEGGGGGNDAAGPGYPRQPGQAKTERRQRRSGSSGSGSDSAGGDGSASPPSSPPRAATGGRRSAAPPLSSSRAYEGGSVFISSRSSSSGGVGGADEESGTGGPGRGSLSGGISTAPTRGGSGVSAAPSQQHSARAVGPASASSLRSSADDEDEAYAALIGSVLTAAQRWGMSISGGGGEAGALALPVETAAGAAAATVGTEPSLPLTSTNGTNSDDAPGSSSVNALPPPYPRPARTRPAPSPSPTATATPSYRGGEGAVSVDAVAQLPQRGRAFPFPATASPAAANQPPRTSTSSSNATSPSLNFFGSSSRDSRDSTRSLYVGAHSSSTGTSSNGLTDATVVLQLPPLPPLPQMLGGGDGDGFSGSGAASPASPPGRAHTLVRKSSMRRTDAPPSVARVRFIPGVVQPEGGGGGPEGGDAAVTAGGWASGAETDVVRATIFSVSAGAGAGAVASGGAFDDGAVGGEGRFSSSGSTAAAKTEGPEQSVAVAT